MEQPIEVVFVFDTTGSMAPCIAQVRRKVEQMLKRLFNDIPGIRIGLAAHGDYCDERDRYVFKYHSLTNNANDLTRWVRNVGNTWGGDAPECYELVIHNGRDRNMFQWSEDARKVYVMIGDDVPHRASESQNKLSLDWKVEAIKLVETGVSVFAVQALNRRHATRFWQELAEIGDGYYLTLNQFADINYLIMGVCYQQASPEQLQQYEDEVVDAGHMTRAVDAFFRVLTGRKESRFKPADTKLKPVEPGRFQVLDVDIHPDDVDKSGKKVGLKKFVLRNGLKFKIGRGFYELTKTEKIQIHKEVVLVDSASGDVWSGDAARGMLDLEPRQAGVKDTSLTVSRSPRDVPDGFIAFVQSTSYNRNLIADTKFLYEVAEDGTEEEMVKGAMDSDDGGVSWV